jgi:hypothetical protein
VVGKVRERLVVCKQTMHRVYMERFSLKKLNEVECIKDISGKARRKETTKKTKM